MNQTFRLIICLFCLSVAVACQQEEEMTVTAPETVTLTLNIGTQSSGSASTRADDPNVLPYEGIRTLRILVISDATDPKDRKILYNQKHDIDKMGKMLGIEKEMLVSVLSRRELQKSFSHVIEKINKLNPTGQQFVITQISALIDELLKIPEFTKKAGEQNAVDPKENE